MQAVPLVNVSVISQGTHRKRASCGCGWTAKPRRFLFLAMGDASDHRIRTGHQCAEPLVTPAA